VSALLGNLIRFGQVLRAAGLDVPAGAIIDVAAALAYIDIGSRSDVHLTLRSLLVRRAADLATFDHAFRLFWRPPGRAPAGDNLRSLGERRRFGPPEAERPEPPEPSAAEAADDKSSGTLARVVPLTYSDREALRDKDFAALTDDELGHAQRMIADLRWTPDERRTRRWRAGRGAAPDWRRLLAAAVRHAAEPIRPPTRVRVRRPRPLVVLCDVSGSMERYARMLLHFVHGLTGHLVRVESFLFATRLTRITHDLHRRGADEAISLILQDTIDWGGGTRIGAALRAFNVEWARRVAGRAPVILLISDGWDRGGPDILACEMARLSRLAYRVIWLNPLLGSPDYQPLTRGMQAALPHVDDFLPVHNLNSLERLAARLNELPPSRGGRRRNGRPSSGTPSRGGAGRLAPSGRRPGPRH
jgi:uncharacterized protein with von Willebrand factor type A (vWA) domain